MKLSHSIKSLATASLLFASVFVNAQDIDFRSQVFKKIDIAPNLRAESVKLMASQGCESFFVYGLIYEKYSAMGGSHSFLGCPTTDELGTPDGVGRFNHFQGGSIYFTPKTGAHEVHGLIRDKWASVGWERGFGYPETDELTTPNGKGKFNHFTDGRSIYWSPETGAHLVYGLIRQKWAALAWERGFLGFPTTDEGGTPDGQGRFNHFEGGSIYFHPTHGTHEVHGLIRDKWAATGWERGLGYPRTDEMTTPDGRGRYNHFSNGGSIYWTPETGANAVYGVIFAKWASMGYERSTLGYPTSDEIPSDRADFKRMNKFQKGKIYWRPDLTHVQMNY